MPVASYLSFVNLAAVYGTVTASSEAAGYPASNLLLNSHYLPWRSTATTQQTIVLNLGAARNVDVVALIGGNVGSFSVQQHATDSWGAPTYPGTPQAIKRDFNRRTYRRWFERAPNTPLTLQYTRIVIPAQTPLDGAAYLSLGTLWLGTLTRLPNDPAVAHRPGLVTPRIREKAALGGWGVQYKSGDTFARHSYTREAEMAIIHPGVDDEYAGWMDIDRQIDEAGAFLYLVDYWGEDRGGVWIMQQTSENDWEANWPVATDSWDLEEVVT